MEGNGGSFPLVYAPDASGVYRHVDDVLNGEACGCTCPAPDCGQPLVAKNAGGKRVHHFAHKRGTCAWAAENVIATLAGRALSRAGRMAFPELSFHDCCERRDVVMSPARTLPVVEVSAEFLSGRGAPEVVVTCRSSAGDEKRFAIALCLVHPLKDAHADALRETGVDLVEIDLRSMLKSAKREAGKHYDREALLVRFQDEGFLESILLGEGHLQKTWALNANRDAAEIESRARLEERLAAEKLERERREAEKRERKAREAAERALAEAERKRREEAEAAERVRRRAEREREQAERLAREEAQRAEAEERAKIDVLEQLDQQEFQARDQLGRRWVRCERCGEAKPVEEFMMYGGLGRVNLGVCYDCGRK